MKKIVTLIALLAISTFAAAAAPSASFDTQLNQAKAEIERIAQAGLQRDASSFDTQLNQAKAEIERIAQAGLLKK